MNTMKAIRLRNGFLHVETPLGIVNIMVGLSDHHGRRVDRIEVIPLSYPGEKKILILGKANTRLVECLKARKER